MFWDKGYAPSQNIELLLAKENVTVEEFLEEDDILHECKTLKSLTNYFTRPDVIKRLVELITTEPPEDLPMAQRFRHANMACEVLTLGLPFLDEKLLSDPDSLKLLYSYLENEPPLHPLLSSFFSKTFIMLFTKKPEQDWFLYQQMCLKLLEYIKSQNNFLDLICKHFSTPVVPDLILKMMRDVDGGDIQRNLYEWLTEEKLVERLIGILGNSHEIEKHENVADFLCDLIMYERSIRSNEEQENPLLKHLESETTIENLVNVILDPNAVEDSIVSGISVVLTLIKSLTYVDYAEVGARFEQDEKIRGEILSTVISVVVPRLKDFNELLKNPPKKNQSVINIAQLEDPFGNTRLQVIRLFRMLLETNCEKVVEVICKTDFFETIMQFFKKYCWNNFLHSEVQKCFSIMFDKRFENKSSDNSSSASMEVKENNLSETKASFDNVYGVNNMNDEKSSIDYTEMGNVHKMLLNNHNGGGGGGGPAEKAKSKAVQMLQHHVIGECRIINKLLECWQNNKDSENAEKKKRLGYMGHLIIIFKELKNSVESNEVLRTLLENSIENEKYKEMWDGLTDQNSGELVKVLEVQSHYLANCNAHSDFSGHIVTDFLTETDNWDGYEKHVELVANNFINYATDTSDVNEFLGNFDNEMYDFDLDLGERNNENNHADFMYDDSNVNYSGDDDDNIFDSTNTASGTTTTSTTTTTTAATGEDFWAKFGDDFADFDSHFDSHFDSFINDMGESLGLTTARTTSKYFDQTNENEGNNHDDNHRNITSDDNDDNVNNIDMMHAFKDNNANLEKLTNLENSTTITTNTTINATTNLADISDNDLVKYESIGTIGNNEIKKEAQISDELGSEQTKQQLQQESKEENQNEENQKNHENHEKQQESQLQQNPFEDEDDDFDDDEGMWTKPLGPPSTDEKETDSSNLETKNGPLDVSSLPPDLKADIITNQQLIEACETVNIPFEIEALAQEAYVQNIQKMNSLNDISELIKNKLDKPNIIETNLDDLKLDNSNEEAQQNAAAAITAVTSVSPTDTTTSSSNATDAVAPATPPPTE